MCSFISLRHFIPPPHNSRSSFLNIASKGVIGLICIITAHAINKWALTRGTNATAPRLHCKMRRGGKKKPCLCLWVFTRKHLTAEQQPNQISAIFHPLLIGFWWHFRKKTHFTAALRQLQNHTDWPRGGASQQPASVMRHWGSNKSSPNGNFPLVTPNFLCHRKNRPSVELTQKNVKQSGSMLAQETKWQPPTIYQPHS